MGMKNYYIFAVEPDTDETLETPDKQPVYLGQTTNFSMKTEQEKSIDLDDGTTWIGGEKLSLNFSIIGRLQRPIQVLKIWLIPVVGESTGLPTDEVLVVDLGSEGLQARQTQVETKSGEFEMVHFSAVRRYPAGRPVVSAFAEFWADYRVYIFPYFPADDYERIEIKQAAANPALYSDILVGSAPIRNFVGGFTPTRYSVRIWVDGSDADYLPNNLRGVHVRVVPPQNQGK